MQPLGSMAKPGVWFVKASGSCGRGSVGAWGVGHTKRAARNDAYRAASQKAQPYPLSSCTFAYLAAR